MYLLYPATDVDNVGMLPETAAKKEYPIVQLPYELNTPQWHMQEKD